MTRKDYLNDPRAPKANSIIVAASSFVEDDHGRILMIRRTDNDLYTIPGGALTPGETVTQCAIRETLEETGVKISIVGLVGIFSNPAHVIEYSDGEIRQEFSICFRAVGTPGTERTSSESKEVTWVANHQVPALKIHPSTMLRIRCATARGTTPFYT
ncbi:NUDIX hydrolase [Actinokineospora sp. NPDC004072]